MLKSLTSAKRACLTQIFTSRVSVPIRKLANEIEPRLSENINFLKTLFSESVRAVQPATLIKNQIRVLGCHLAVGERKFQLRTPCYAVGFGKAVLGMAVEIERVLGDRLERAIITVPKGIFEQYPELRGNLKKTECIEGALNNIPDEDAFEGAKRIKNLVEKLKEDDLLIVLISGGGSALLPYPKPPITLQEKQNLIRSLSKSGANIQELNTVRKQLSVLKGGGLAKIAYPCQVVSLILSDVVGDPLDIIASGPTLFCNESPMEAIKILKQYNLYATLPTNVRNVLEPLRDQSNQRDLVTLGRTVASDDLCLAGPFDHVVNFIIGTNRIAADAARKMAAKDGCQCVVISLQVEEDADRLALIYAQLARELTAGNRVKVKELLEGGAFKLEPGAVDQLMGFDTSKRMLLIFAGEPTVVVSGRGRGGRNQQLALAFSLQLNKLGVKSGKSGNISFLSSGTDGMDGPTDAAGAVGYSRLAETCSRWDINPEGYLANNDSYGFFSDFLNGQLLLKIGHSGTNVMDLHFIMIDPED